MQVCKMDKRAQTPLKTNKQIFRKKKKTLLSKHLNDLSRQGRQKGVRICLLFHKASSIFIGFHAGVNIESKTFFLPHRPPHIPTHCPAQNIYFCLVAPLYGITMERRNFIGFHEGLKIESKLFLPRQPPHIPTQSLVMLYA